MNVFLGRNPFLPVESFQASQFSFSTKQISRFLDRLHGCYTIIQGIYTIIFIIKCHKYSKLCIPCKKVTTMTAAFEP